MMLALSPAFRSRLLAPACLLVAVRLTAAPTITRQPTDVTATSGQNATFTVTAAGAGALTYQWRRSGFPIPGATSATFVWGGTTLGESGFYDVLVSDSSGTTRSDVVVLNVAPRAYPAGLALDTAYLVPLDANDGVTIRGLAPSSTGGYYVAGSFAAVDGLRRTFVMRVSNAGAVDPTFVPLEITGSGVSAVAEQPDGKVIIGGYFSHIGSAGRCNLARLNSDGSLDSSFQSPAPNPGAVAAVVIQSDGRIVTASSDRPAVARYNADGSFDGELGNLADQIYGMVRQADGKLIVTGIITGSTSATGQSQSETVRLTADGSVDATFQAPRYNGAAEAIALGSDGSVYVAGYPNPGCPALVRYSSTGAVDASFSPQFDMNGVESIAAQGDGRLLVGGSFYAVNGTARQYLARLNHDGSVDASFVPSAPADHIISLLLRPDGSVIAGPYDFNAAQGGPIRYLADGTRSALPNFAMRGRGYVNDIVTLPGGSLGVVGQFDRAGSLSTTNLLRLTGDGTLDSTFAATALPRNVNAVAALPDGRFAIAGAFSDFMGQAILGAAIVKSDGSPDYSFLQNTTIPVRGAALTVTPDGKIVVGGYLGSSNPLLGAVVAYNLDGSLVTSFATGPSFNGQIRQVIAQRDARILVSGWFNDFRGTSVSQLVRLNADGTLDTAFAANVHITSATTVRLAPAGQIYVSGAWNGPDGTAYGIVRLNADGTRDSSYHCSLSGSVDAFILQPDDKVIARVTPGSVTTPYLTRFNLDGSVDSTFRTFNVDVAPASMGTVMVLRDDGRLEYVEGQLFANRLSATVPVFPPVITAAPSATILPVGGSTTLRVAASSLIPFMYQWQYNGAPIAGATNATYTVANFSAATAGNYSVVVSNQLGSTATAPVAVTAPLDLSGHLVNLSIRATGSDTNPLVLGVVLGGAGTGGPKPLLFRAAGPTLTYFNVPGALADPVLELYDGTGFKIDQNDDWSGVFDFTSVGAFPFRGTAPKDAAIYNPYATNGAQTIHILGKAGAGGVVLGEVYDAGAGDAFTAITPRIVNGSARTGVGTGDNALILGFGIAGQGSVRVLIRAVGPTLAAAPFNLGGMLVDPTLEIRAVDNSIVATNDDWWENGAAASMTTAFDSVGAFHLAAGSKDSAAVVTLSPGTYSAVVRGANATTGTAMVELYVLP